MADRERVIDKVRKLMRFDEHTATKAEVENAMRLAQEMMEKHSIDSSELGVDDTAETIERSLRKSMLTGARVTKWERQLAITVKTCVPGVSFFETYEPRRHFGRGVCDMGTFYWYGPDEIVEVAKELFDETRAVVATMAVGSYGSVYNTQGRSYCIGFAYALSAMVSKRRDASDNAERVASIVLASDAANKEWLRDEHGFEIEESQAGPPRGEFDEQALKLGVRDGKNHDVTPREPTKKIEQAAGVRPALPAGGA